MGYTTVGMMDNQVEVGRIEIGTETVTVTPATDTTKTTMPTAGNATQIIAMIQRTLNPNHVRVVAAPNTALPGRKTVTLFVLRGEQIVVPVGSRTILRQYATPEWMQSEATPWYP